jgi:hypothetical protein
MKAAPLSLDEQGGSNATTTKATSINSSKKLIFLPFHRQILIVIQLILNMVCGSNVQYVCQ